MTPLVSTVLRCSVGDSQVLRRYCRRQTRKALREKCAYVSRAGEIGETQVDDRLTWLPPGMAEPLVIDVARLFASP